jgi:translation elongation factor EF-Tu-like GTPase
MKNLRVSITMLKNGRINPIQEGYRPHMVIIERQGDFVITEIFKKKMVYPGETFEGIIEIIHPHLFDDFNIRQNFIIYEGRKIVGTGKVLEVLR